MKKERLDTKGYVVFIPKKYSQFVVGLWKKKYHTCRTVHTKIPTTAVKLISYFTDSSEKVIIAISLARICVTV